MDKVIKLELGDVSISDPYFSMRSCSKVQVVSFTPKEKQGWGISKEFPAGSNFDDCFITAFVDEVKDFV